MLSKVTFRSYYFPEQNELLARKTDPPPRKTRGITKDSKKVESTLSLLHHRYKLPRMCQSLH